MTKTETTALRRFRLHAVAAAIVLVSAGNAGAFQIDTGNPDLALRFDNTVRYNLGMRADSQDVRILNNPAADESDNRFDKHDIVTNRVDLLTELDMSYKGRVGARLTGAAWYDDAYSSGQSKPYGANSSSYKNSTYNDEAKRYVVGPSGEFLDAFVWGNFSLGSIPVNVKVGRQTNYWGEGLLFGAHAISYSQAPTDGVKAVASPGIETKEVFLPIGQIAVKAQVTNALSVSLQSYYEWRETRAPFGGTYFATTDFLRADSFGIAPPQVPVASQPLFKATPVIAPQRPDKVGNWGVNARYSLEAIESTLGAYYRVFDDYNPTLQINPPAFVRMTFPRDVKLAGVSFNRVIGGISVGSEVSYRKNGALNAKKTDANGVGPRGDTWHAVLNGIKLLPSTPLFDTGSLVVEVAYSRLQKITRNENLYNGYAPTAAEGCGSTRDKTDGCSGKQWAGIAVNFTPQYLQVLPSLDVDVPFTVNYGIRGNAPSAGGGSEGSLSYSAGVRATFASLHEFTLRYADTKAKTRYVTPAPGFTIASDGGAGYQATDRGWLVFTYKVGF